jgi:hypothetical protein
MENISKKLDLGRLLSTYEMLHTGEQANMETETVKKLSLKAIEVKENEKRRKELILEARRLFEKEKLPRGEVCMRLGISYRRLGKYLIGNPDSVCKNGNSGQSRGSVLDQYFDMIAKLVDENKQYKEIHQTLLEYNCKVGYPTLFDYCVKMFGDRREAVKSRGNSKQHYVSRKQILEHIWSRKPLEEYDKQWIFSIYPGLFVIRDSVSSFRHVMEQMNENLLKDWIQQEVNSQIAKIQSFCNGILRDMEPVLNSVRYSASHIIFNSTSIDCTRKFRNFWGSTLAVRKISDRLCLENGLSIIENPRKSGRDYGGWLGDRKAPSEREKLCNAIDAALAQKPADFAAFLLIVQAEGYQVKQGKNLAFCAPGKKKFIRCRSLDDDYTEQAIMERIEGKRPLTPSMKKASRRREQQVNLLIDIQARLQAGKGPGYEQWAKIFNLKQAAQTLNFLSEHGLLEYTQLKEKAVQSTIRFNELSDKIKEMESHLCDIGTLKTQISNYVKTREAYVAYRKAGYSRKFYVEHESQILLHKAAKQAFDVLNVKKLPTVKTLQTDYETLLSEKKKAYSEYAAARKELRELLPAKANVDRLLSISATETNKEKKHEVER